MKPDSLHDPSDGEISQPVGHPVPDWSAPRLPPRQTMEGQFCRLEPLDADRHSDSLYHALSADDRGWTYLPYGPFPSQDRFLEWLKHDALGEDPQFWAITRQSDHRPLGLASYLRINPESGSIEVGHLHFSKEMRQSPLATEAMFLMMKQAFDLGYRRYEWKCDSLNLPSRTAAQRLGFSFEGVFRQATIYKGRNRDTAWYAVIDTDWPALSDAFSSWLDSSNFDADGRQRTSLRQLTEPLLVAKG